MKKTYEVFKLLKFKLRKSTENSVSHSERSEESVATNTQTKFAYLWLLY